MANFRADASSDEDEWSDNDFWDDAGQFDLLNDADDPLDDFHGGESDSEGEPLGSDVEVEDDPDDMPLFYLAPNFQWHSNAPADFDTADRRPFEKRPGPVRVIDGTATALSYFQLFYSDEVFATITRLTNESAERKRRDEPDKNKGAWWPVTLPEMKALYGVFLMMDILKLDRDASYWIPGGEGAEFFMMGTNIPLVFTRDRYMQLRRYLSFSEPPAAGTRDKLAKVRYMLDTMRAAFKAEYVPHRELSVDEAMIPFKGRLAIKQYMKEKPVKFGIKVWVCADAVTAYCHNFEIYVGKSEDRVDAAFGQSGKVVVAMTKHLFNAGHVIYTDNFYTSPTLAHYLQSKDTYLCGTVRSNRKGYPRDLVKTAAEARRLPRGATDQRYCGNMVAQSWKDNRMVYYLSTFHQPTGDDTVQRRQKDGTVTHIPCSPLVSGYQKYMGGVDHMDQMTRQNKTKKTMKWYRRVERKLLECSIFNAFVIEDSVICHKQDGRKQRGMFQFKLELAHQLVGTFRQPRRRPGRPRSNDNQHHLRLDNSLHLIVPGVGHKNLCAVCSIRHNSYQRAHPGITAAENPHKKRRSTMKCEKCDVYLCCNRSTTCYKDWHTFVHL